MIVLEGDPPVPLTDIAIAVAAVLVAAVFGVGCGLVAGRLIFGTWW
jgi:hypothetical protein